MARGLTSQGVMDKNEFALVIIEIATKLVTPCIVLSQEYIIAVFLTPEKRYKKNNTIGKPNSRQLK